MNLEVEVKKAEELLKLLKEKQKVEAEEAGLKFWVPEEGERMYYIGGDGVIYSGNALKGSILQGGAFETYADAVNEIRYREAVYQLKKAIHILNKGYNGWQGDIVRNYSISLAHGATLSCDNYRVRQPVQSWFYIRTEESAMELIRTHGDALITYLRA